MHAHLLFLGQDCKYSSDIIAVWEAKQKSEISNSKHRRSELKSVLQMCGLSTNKLSVRKMRSLLISLKGVELPVSTAEVDHLLVHNYGQVIGGMCNSCIFISTDCSLYICMHAIILQFLACGLHNRKISSSPSLWIHP